MRENILLVEDNYSVTKMELRKKYYVKIQFDVLSY